MDLNGKTAVVTGGTKGIGYSIAEALLLAGANVFICGRSESDLTRSKNDLAGRGRVDGWATDVRSEDRARTMLDKCEQAFGGVDILVNNAGIGIIGKTVEEMSCDEFRQTLETNLFG